jgi:hypothetical protein
MSLFGKMFSKSPSPEAERARQLIEQAQRDSKRPKGSDKMALRGAATRDRVFGLIEEVEAEIGQHAVGFAQKEGVMMVHPKLLARIRQQSDGAMLEPALYAAFVTPDATRRLNKEWPSTVRKYKGRPNTEDLLSEKSTVLSVFICHNLDIGTSLYQETHSAGPELDDAQESKLKLEESACWYRVIDELAHRYIGQERVLFMDHFQDQLSGLMALQGVPPTDLCDTMAARSTEYAGYKKWTPKGREGAGGTLLWEAAKHAAEAFEDNRNPVFLMTFGLRFLQRVEAASLYELLTGRDPPKYDDPAGPP